MLKSDYICCIIGDTYKEVVMKLGILCNFGPPHIGGSESVIKNISTQLIKGYKYEVSVFSFNYDRISVFEGINLVPCLRGEKLVQKLNDFDHLFVYSDGFWEWETILKNIDKIKPNVTIAMVGMYHMMANNELYGLFKRNIDRYSIITHFKGNDYKKCLSDGMTVNVIPNGVDLDEFRSNTVNFRKKYDIKEKYIILNVSNFFFGKNQDMLADIGKKLKFDYIIVQISNTVKYPYDERFLKRCKDKCKDVNVRFLRNIPREDVVAAFNCSDVFCFTSKKEVAALVILESISAKLPWVSMEVGNVLSQPGGMMAYPTNRDEKGYSIIDKVIVDDYVRSIEKVLENTELRECLIGYGQYKIEELDWKNIVPEYDKVFRE